jgi:hypothetical protein
MVIIIFENKDDKKLFTNNNKSLVRSSKIMKSFSKGYGAGAGADESNLFTNPNKTYKDKDATQDHTDNSIIASDQPISSFTPYVLIVAISFHGLFEGLALGLQRELNESLVLLIPILLNKLIDSFYLVKFKFILIIGKYTN